MIPGSQTNGKPSLQQTDKGHLVQNSIYHDNLNRVNKKQLQCMIEKEVKQPLHQESLKETSKKKLQCMIV